MKNVQPAPRYRTPRAPLTEPDGRTRTYPPRRFDPSVSEQTLARPGLRTRREARQSAGFLSLALLALAGSLVHAAQNNTDSATIRRNNQIKAAEIAKAAQEQISDAIEDADFNAQALILNEGTKIYTNSDADGKVADVVTGIGVIEQPSRVQLGQEDGYAYWYRFTMPAQEGTQPTVGWIPASIIDGQNAGFIPSLQGKNGVVAGEYDDTTQEFSIDGEPAARLHLYRDAIAANTAVAQNYVLPLPIQAHS